VLLVLIFLPVAISISLLAIKDLPSEDRSYEATFEKVGWRINMKEQNVDSLLHFTFRHIGKDKTDSISFCAYNNYCDDVITFLMIEGQDTVYIRKGCEFLELFPPEEQSEHTVAPKDFYVDNPIVGKLPSAFKMVAFSDSCFFVYDKKKCTYVPKDDNIHIVTLFHNTERGDSYSLYDVTRTDTMEVELIQKR
jgi:hypothetical protein